MTQTKPLNGIFLGLTTVLALSGLSCFAANTHQLGFLILWCCTMLLVTLPLLILEFALSNRHTHAPLLALSTLTREADASTRWRLVGWFGLAGVTLLAFTLLQHNAHVLPAFATQIHLTNTSSFIALVICALAMSFLPTAALVLALVSLLASTALNLTANGVTGLSTTTFTATDAAIAASLAVVGNMVGLGVFWHRYLENSQHKKQVAAQQAKQQPESKILSIKSATPSLAQVFAVFAVQLVCGALILLAQSAPQATPTVTLSSNLLLLGQVFLAAYFIHHVLQNLSARGISKPLQAVWILVGAALCWVAQATPAAQYVAIILALVAALGLSVFAGWQMKTSHLRKAIGFGHEATYNLWRVAVRLVIPATLLLCIVGLIEKLLV